MHRFLLGLASLTSLVSLACSSNGTTGGTGGQTSSASSTSSTSTSVTGASSTASSSAQSTSQSSSSGTGGGPNHTFIALPMGSQPYGLAVDDAHVYWTNSGTGEVMQASKADGTGQVVLTTGEDTPIAVKVSAGSVFWVSYSINGKLRYTPIGGGAVTTVCDAPAAVDLAVGSTYVWWTREPDDVQRAPIAGLPMGQMPDLLTGNSLSLGITADDNNLFWVDRQDGSVKRANQDLTGDTIVAVGDVPWDITVDANHIYWTEFGSLTDSGKVKQASKLDGSNAIEVATGLADPKGIAIDATNIYWVDSYSGKIEKAPIGGGPKTTLATDEKDPLEIVVDATSVYWTARGSDTIGKAPK